MPMRYCSWVLEDDYSLLDASEKFLKCRAYTRAHWEKVAGTLETRLQAMSKPRTPSFANRYRREGLLNQLLDAYDRARLNDRIIPRLEDEADACLCYPRLCNALLAAGEREGLLALRARPSGRCRTTAAFFVAA